MKQYLDLVNTVLENGKIRTNRTGVNTLMYFGYHYKVDLQKGYPLLTTKKVFFNSVVRELLWYLTGETHIRNLREHTKIWDSWTSEEKNWEIGKMYGYQWVKWEKFSTNSFYSGMIVSLEGLGALIGGILISAFPPKNKLLLFKLKLVPTSASIVPRL